MQQDGNVAKRVAMFLNNLVNEFRQCVVVENVRVGVAFLLVKQVVNGNLRRLVIGAAGFQGHKGDIVVADGVKNGLKTVVEKFHQRG